MVALERLPATVVTPQAVRSTGPIERAAGPSWRICASAASVGQRPCRGPTVRGGVASRIVGMVQQESIQFTMHLFLFASRGPAKRGVLTASWAHAHVAGKAKSEATEACNRGHVVAVHRILRVIGVSLVDVVSNVGEGGMFTGDCALVIGLMAALCAAISVVELSCF